MKIKHFHYILLIFAFFAEVSPFFFGTAKHRIVLGVLLIFIFVSQKKQVNKEIIFWSSLFLFLSVMQSILYGGRSFLAPVANIIWTIITPFFLFKIIGIKVFKHLYNIILFTAKYSLFVWVLHTVIGPFQDLIIQASEWAFEFFKLGDIRPRALLFYTAPFSKVSDATDIYRNNGIYHEPGAFGFWLIVGIVLKTIQSKSLFNKDNHWLMIALVTSFSSAAYLQLAFLVAYYFLVSGTFHVLLKIILIPLFGGLMFIGYDSISFLGDKIGTQYKEETGKSLEKVKSVERFASTRRTLNAITTHPIFGYGLALSDEKIEDKTSTIYVATASLAVFAGYGVVFGFVFYYYFFRGFNFMNHCYNANPIGPLLLLILFLAIILGGFAQRFINVSIMNLFVVAGLLGNFKAQKLKALSLSRYQTK